MLVMRDSMTVMFIYCWSYVGSSSTTQSIVLTRVPSCACVTVTDTHGDRVYLRFKLEKEAQATQQQSQGALQLLTVPFLDLKDNIEEEVNCTLLT